MQQLAMIQWLIVTVLVGCIAAAISYFPSHSLDQSTLNAGPPRCSEFVYGSTRKSVMLEFANCLAEKVMAQKLPGKDYRIDKTRHYKYGEVWDLSVSVISRMCYGEDMHWYFDLDSLELVDRKSIEWMC